MSPPEATDVAAMAGVADVADLGNLAVPMRDGTWLRADVYLPAMLPAPTLLAAAPYQKALRHLPSHPQFPFRETGPIDWYVARGYAYVWLDLRASAPRRATGPSEAARRAATCTTPSSGWPPKPGPPGGWG